LLTNVKIDELETRHAEVVQAITPTSIEG
jgi:hypothetical protein